MCLKKSYTPLDMARKIHVSGCVQKKITLDSSKICSENLCSSRTWLEEKMFNSPRMWLERSCTPPGSRKKLHYPGICPEKSYTPPECGKKKLHSPGCVREKHLLPKGLAGKVPLSQSVDRKKLYSTRMRPEKSNTPTGYDKKQFHSPRIWL